MKERSVNFHEARPVAEAEFRASLTAEELAELAAGGLLGSA